MPKDLPKKRHGASTWSPDGKSAARTKAHNNIFKMNTDIGQHVLKNPGIAAKIVEKADLRQSDTVLEIGPGSGNLTAKILEKAKKVVAIELDPRMAAELSKRFQGTPQQKRLEICLGDAIAYPFPYFDVCISNTPYAISSPLTFKLLATSPVPRTCVLMFQREFALRLLAKAGDKLYSRLSLNCQMWSRVEHIMKVGRNNFNPPPAVESSVVRISPKNPRPQISYEEWDGLLRIAFNRKNKTLRASFFGVTSVMDLLEMNYRTWCAQNDILIEDGPAEESEDVDIEVFAQPEDEQIDGDMDVDDNEDVPDFFKDDSIRTNRITTKAKSDKKKRSKVAKVVREKVRTVLEEDTKLGDKRARMCDESDFLKLLWAFNQKGIHFT